MKTLTFAVIVLAGCLAFYKPAHSSPSTIGPTMLVITNCLQRSDNPGGPWTNVAEFHTTVWKSTPPSEFYRAVLKSSGTIP